MRNKTLWIVLAVIVILVLYGVSSYNKFISLNVAIDGQWAQVENQYQRRFDLIPNLVASVKGVLTQEQKIFGDIADARTRYAGAANVNDKVQAANQLESSLARLLVIVENYPVLQSSATVQNLMVSLEGTENRVSVERMRFNDMVKDFDTRVLRFPTNMLAGIFGFSERAYFQVSDEAKQVPQVDLTK